MPRDSHLTIFQILGKILPNDDWIELLRFTLHLLEMEATGYGTGKWSLWQMK